MTKNFNAAPAFTPADPTGPPVEAVQASLVPEMVTNEALIGALNHMPGILGRVDAVAPLGTDENVRRQSLQTEGEALAQQLETDQYVNPAEVAAVLLLSAGPHFAHAQEALRGARGAQRRQLVAVASSFNGLIRDYADNDPKADTGQLLEAFLAVGKTLKPDAHSRASEYSYWCALYGAQHEVAARHILSLSGQELRQATLRQDLNGVDLIVGGIPIDIKASPDMVRKKCGPDDTAEDSTWGANNGVLVLWSHLTSQQLGGSFRVGPQLEQQIYDEHIAPILGAAATNSNIVMEGK